MAMASSRVCPRNEMGNPVRHNRLMQVSALGVHGIKTGFKKPTAIPELKKERKTKLSSSLLYFSPLFIFISNVGSYAGLPGEEEIPRKCAHCLASFDSKRRSFLTFLCGLICMGKELVFLRYSKRKYSFIGANGEKKPNFL